MLSCIRCLPETTPQPVDWGSDGRDWSRLIVSSTGLLWEQVCYALENHLLAILWLASRNMAHAASDRWQWCSQAGSPLGGHLVHNWMGSDHYTLLHPHPLCSYSSSWRQKAGSVIIVGEVCFHPTLVPASAPFKGALAAFPYWDMLFHRESPPLPFWLSHWLWPSAPH